MDVPSERPKTSLVVARDPRDHVDIDRARSAGVQVGRVPLPPWALACSLYKSMEDAEQPLEAPSDAAAAASGPSVSWSEHPLTRQAMLEVNEVYGFDYYEPAEVSSCALERAEPQAPLKHVSLRARLEQQREESASARRRRAGTPP